MNLSFFLCVREEKKMKTLRLSLVSIVAIAAVMLCAHSAYAWNDSLEIANPVDGSTIHTIRTNIEGTWFLEPNMGMPGGQAYPNELRLIVNGDIVQARTSGLSSPFVFQNVILEKGSNSIEVKLLYTDARGLPAGYPPIPRVVSDTVTVTVQVDGEIRGRVYDILTDEPLDHRRIYLHVKENGNWITAGETLTDSDGRYLFDELVRYKIKSACLGTQKVWQTYRILINDITYRPNPYTSPDLKFSNDVYKIVHDVGLKYYLYGTIKGHVKGDFDPVTGMPGVPLEGATVTLKVYPYEGYGLIDRTVTTDENGNYILEDVQRFAYTSGGQIFFAKYTAHISKERYKDHVSGDGELAFSEEIDEIVYNATLELRVLGTASGIVTGSYGPGYMIPDVTLEGATVTLKVYPYEGYGLIDRTVTTDEDGYYLVDDLQRFAYTSGGQKIWAKYTAHISKEDYSDYESEGGEVEFSPEVYDIVHDATLIMAPPVIHVSSNADTGGDGSAEAPFRTIKEGLDVALYEATVLVNAGIYQPAAELTIPIGVTLKGVDRDSILIWIDGLDRSINLEDETTLESLTIIAGSAGACNPIRAYDDKSDLKIIGNRIIALATGPSTVIQTQGGVNNEIRNNVIIADTTSAPPEAASGVFGIFADSHIDGGFILPVNLKIVNNTVAVMGNKAQSAIFVYYSGSEASNIVKNNAAVVKEGTDPSYSSWGINAPGLTVNYNAFFGDLPPVSDGTTLGVGNLLSLDKVEEFEDLAYYHPKPESYLVDTGDPQDDYSNEPDYPAGYINIGAYGNTPEATTN